MELIEAVINNDTDLVRKLLEEGTDPNVYLDEACVTPLHFAAQNNSLESVPLLITAGADLHARIHPEGYTALNIAELHQLRQLFNSFSPLMMALLRVVYLMIDFV